MKVKFMTVKGAGSMSRTPYYIGVPQHERIMSKKEAYAYCAEKTGYRQTAIQAVFQAMARYVRENAAKGNVTYIDGICHADLCGKSAPCARSVYFRVNSSLKSVGTARSSSL